MRPRNVSFAILTLLVLGSLVLAGCNKPEPTEVAPPGGIPSKDPASANRPASGGGVNTGPRPTLQ